MARTKTSFTSKTAPRRGRKPGAKDIVPRSVKASIVAIVRDIVERDPTAIRRALREGLLAKPPKSFPYHKLAAEYLDGKPPDRVELTGENGAPLTFTLLPGVKRDDSTETSP